MKKSCKHINITDAHTIEPFVYDCIMRHKNRSSVRSMLKRTIGMTSSESAALLNNDYTVASKLAFRLAEVVAEKIKTRSIPKFVPVITVKHDVTTNKERLIGRETALQQIFDYIAVYGCSELWRKKFVIQQCSSIKGRGQVYGMKLIKSYIDKDNRQIRYAKKHKLRYTRQCKYFVKLDIKKCYPSVDKKVLFDKLQHDIGNEDMLYLWRCLLNSYGRAKTPDDKPYTGLMMGALPSQFAAQFLIGNIYRFVMDSGVASHMVVFMDDMLIFAPNRRKLKKLVEQTIEFAKNMLHLTIKPNWHIRNIDKFSVDMMGYVVHSNGKVSMRTRNFLRARRLFLRFSAHKFGIRSARRLVSYKGFFKHSDTTMTVHKYQTHKIFGKAQELLSRKAKNESLLQHGTTENHV